MSNGSVYSCQKCDKLSIDPDKHKCTTKPTKIELWVLTDKSGRIYYSGFSEETVVYYKESNGFNDKQVIKLTGEIKND